MGLSRKLYLLATITTRLLKEKGILDRYCYLRKDNEGFYLEYAFQEGIPHDNRCLSRYLKDREVDEIHYIVQNSCGYEKLTGESHCSPGHPKKACLKNGSCPENWTIDNPSKCACWCTTNMCNLENETFTLSQILSVINNEK